jgi:hypothetical protein
MSLQQGHYLVFNLCEEIEETSKNVMIRRLLQGMEVKSMS